jgi:hypothetical protein
VRKIRELSREKSANPQSTVIDRRSSFDITNQSILNVFRVHFIDKELEEPQGHL